MYQSAIDSLRNNFNQQISRHRNQAKSSSGMYSDNYKRISKDISRWRRTKSMNLIYKSNWVSRQLEIILDDIDQSIQDPKEAIRLLSRFCDLDNNLYHQVDDSYAHISGVLEYMTPPVFTKFARQIEDEKWLIDLLHKSLLGKNWDTWLYILEKADQFLSESRVSELFEKFKANSTMKKFSINADKKMPFRSEIKILAFQLGDEEAYVHAVWPYHDSDITEKSCLEIAEFYLEHGQNDKAKDYLTRISSNWLRNRKAELLFKLYEAEGDVTQLIQVRLKHLRQQRSVLLLDDIVKIAGEDRRQELISDEIRFIKKGDEVDYFDLKFLIDTEQIDEAEAYIWKWQKSIHGSYWGPLTDILESLGALDRPLSETILYRAMLQEILDRTRYKAYWHGVDYLEMLDSLSGKIKNWQGLEEHSSYRESLFEVHKRKTTFWRRAASRGV